VFRSLGLGSNGNRDFFASGTIIWDGHLRTLYI
jgi:hypothetical protein